MGRVIVGSGVFVFLRLVEFWFYFVFFSFRFLWRGGERVVEFSVDGGLLR